jgi:diaminohydroxyphosphoribosylaminopyrimidine deaminase/5-amino-6-(5-phosphoribosylamino)uracil reductase
MSTTAPTHTTHALWQPWLRHAARLAVRGHGAVEPNPMVGCVVLDACGVLAGEGYHRRVGGPHAEVEALRAAGERARGGTAIVTLEPCNHHGRTGPCTEALAAAGVARVVYACADPSANAGGGARRLREMGIEVAQVPCPEAEAVSRPFLHRVRTGLPWVALKWAQTLDGAIARPAGEPRWISGARSRARVHRERGRVDAVLTGMGTVLADDPLLTARGVPVRRVAIRVVWDPRLELPLTSQLARTAREVPVVVGTTPEAAAGRTAHRMALEDAGAAVVPVTGLRALLRWLAAERGVATVLAEAGGGLVRTLLADALANEAWIFVAPRLLEDPSLPRILPPRRDALVGPCPGMEILSVRRSGEDALVHCRAPVRYGAVA